MIQNNIMICETMDRLFLNMESLSHANYTTVYQLISYDISPATAAE